MTTTRFSPLSAIALLPALLACAQPSSPSATSAAGPSGPPTIQWNRESLRLVQPGGTYGRMARLANGRIACAYDRGGKMWIRHSSDDGTTWAEPVLVAEERGCTLTNADLLPLRGGSLLCFWNERPLEAMKYHDRHPPLSVALTRPFRIRMSRSDDHGRTWAAPQTLYAAGNRFQDGCWEPAGLELPDGEIHVYFANEGPFRESDEQEIALVRSRDGGNTWGEAERIAMRAGRRDGMPSPLLLAGGRGIAVAIEDNGLDGGGDRFKPVILHATLADNWRSGPVAGDSPRRRGALAEPLPPQWYGGAPCLRRFDSGLTVLSYQQSEDGTLASARMVVCIGDADARNFSHPTTPFPATDAAQLWNALLIKDDHTITAITGTSIDGQSGIWAIDGDVR